MAKPRKAVSAAQVREILARYEQGIGLHLLGLDFRHAPSVIRRVLVENGIEIRRMGRPNK